MNPPPVLGRGPCAGEVCRRDVRARSDSMTRFPAIVVLYGLSAVALLEKEKPE